LKIFEKKITKSLTQKVIKFFKKFQKVSKSFKKFQTDQIIGSLPIKGFSWGGQILGFSNCPNGFILGSSKMTILTGQKSSVFAKKFSLFEQNFQKFSKNAKMKKFFKKCKNEKK